jgi:hypothetical protein
MPAGRAPAYYHAGLWVVVCGDGLITTSELPDEALLRKYRDAGAYTDCYVVDVAKPVSQAEYVEAFYTTWIFKLERLLLDWLVSKPSTDVQAKALAADEVDSFAAWHVEGRTGGQLLMCDYQQRTRSWLMSVEISVGGISRTRLYFGSAVVPVENARSGRRSMGAIFVALLGFHRLYSRILLHAAAARVTRRRRISN